MSRAFKARVFDSGPPTSDREQIRRGTADGRIAASVIGGRIKVETLVELMRLLEEKTDYRFHIELAVVTNALLKTVDNEDDALETIRRLREAPPKAKK